MALNLFFMISDCFLVSVLELRGGQKSKNSGSVYASVSGGPLDRFGTTLGSILEPFWGHLKLFFEVV